MREMWEMVETFVTRHRWSPFGKTQGGASHSTARQQRVERRRAAQAIPQPGNNEWRDAGRRKPFHSQATTSGKTQGGASHSTARQQRVERRRAAQAPPPPVIPSPAPTGGEQAGAD